MDHVRMRIVNGYRESSNQHQQLLMSAVSNMNHTIAQFNHKETGVLSLALNQTDFLPHVMPITRTTDYLSLSW